MITKEIDINGEKFHLTLTDRIINQVNNLKSLYNAAYEDPESFEQISTEISSTIQEISSAVEPKADSEHLDGLIQEIIKTVDGKIAQMDKISNDKTEKKVTKKSKRKK